MTSGGAAGSPFDLEAAIRDEAVASGLELPAPGLQQLAAHAQAVRDAGPELHLTSIRDSAELVRRHVGEALQGAALLNPSNAGDLLDLGSGNGYPGLAVCLACPGLRPVLAEANARRASFLGELVAELRPQGEVLQAHVQRPGDLRGLGPFQVIVTRAARGWEKTLPRLCSALAPNGRLMVWAGDAMEPVSRRAAWQRFELHERIALRDRDRSWIWCFTRAGTPS